MINTPRLYFPAIDGIRAIAVLLVIFFHLEIPYFQGGFVGVDVFFVISGFLITRNILSDLSDQCFSFRRFYIARFRRLIPALLATIAVSLLLAFLLYSPDALIRVSGSAIAGVLSLANIRFWMSAGYFDLDAAAKPLLHLWSLSVEEQFYFVWPLFLVLVFRFVGTNISLFVTILGILCASLFWSQAMLQQDSSAAFYLVQFRAHEFAIGALLAWSDKRMPFGKVSQSKWSLNAITIIGISILLFVATTFDDQTPFPGYSSLFPCIAAALLIYSKQSEVAKLLLSNSCSRGIGNISYSLYLVHWPILVFWSYWYFESPSLWHKGGLFCAILLFGYVLYVSVEKKFRKAKSRKDSNANQTLFFSVLFLVVISILFTAWQARINKGWPNRIHEPVSLSPANDINCDYQDGSKRRQVCELGVREGSLKRGLLIGDSHSMNLRYGLDSFAKSNNLSFQSISYAGCPPLVGVELAYNLSANSDQSCLEFSRNLSELLTEGDFDVVLIAARWMWHYEHMPYHESSRPNHSYLLDSEHRKLTAGSSRDVWLAGLNRTLNLITDRNKKVVLFSQAPLLSKGIGECDKSPSYLIDAAKNRERCTVQIPYETIMQRLSFTNKAILDMANDNVLAIIPSEYICNKAAQTCDILVEDGLLYADADHLSRVGSLFILNSIEQLLVDFINGE